MKRRIEIETRAGWKYLNGGPPNNEPLPLDAKVVTYASGILQTILHQAYLNATASPDWLYQITYGLSEARKIRVLLENDRYAVVQSPGGMWWDNSGGHYGKASYDLVDKRKLDTYRKGVGLMDCKEIQHGGRAKLAQWKKLIEMTDEEIDVQLATTRERE